MADGPDLTDAQVRRAQERGLAKRGCSRALIPALVVLGIGVILGIILLIGGSKDDKACAQDTSGGPCAQDTSAESSAPDTSAQPAVLEPTVTPTEPAVPAVAGCSDAAAKYEGHYVLTSGLDNAKGIDAHRGAFPVDSIGVSTATIDVDAKCSVTGGSYHTSADGTPTGARVCHYQGDGEGASGTLTSEGIGTVYFNVAFTITDAGDGTCPTNAAAGSGPLGFAFGIDGTELHLCAAPELGMASATACGGGNPVWAVFTKS